MEVQEHARDLGSAWAKTMAAKLGTHEGSEGHPVNFERSGEWHKLVQRFASESYRRAFIEGYRTAWNSAILRR